MKEKDSGDVCIASAAVNLQRTVLCRVYNSYNDIYDFAKTLVIDCNIDPDYVLQNLLHIYKECAYGFFIKISDELSSYPKVLSQDEVNAFLENLEKLKEENKKTKKIIDFREEEIILAKRRYQKLKFIQKYWYLIKDGRPKDNNFEQKSTKEISRMYKKY